MVLGLALVYQYHYQVGYFESNTEYLIIAVSGGLQHGETERGRMAMSSVVAVLVLFRLSQRFMSCVLL